LGYFSSGFVLKRAKGKLRKRGGIFARTWPEWLTLETAFNLELDWIFLQYITFVEELSELYPEVKIIVWQTGVILPPVEILFSSQWLPPKTHSIWGRLALELILSSVKKTRFKRHLTWKANPFVLKHEEVGGSSTVERTLYIFPKESRWEQISRGRYEMCPPSARTTTSGLKYACKSRGGP
jgi:hypothetical protein